MRLSTLPCPTESPGYWWVHDLYANLLGTLGYVEHIGTIPLHCTGKLKEELEIYYQPAGRQYIILYAWEDDSSPCFASRFHNPAAMITRIPLVHLADLLHGKVREVLKVVPHRTNATDPRLNSWRKAVQLINELMVRELTKFSSKT
ncbi:MAG: hypothetical protein U0V64_01055 [Cyclobacteriaceae bacterium]